MLHTAGKVVPRRPRTTVLMLALAGFVLLIAFGAAGYWYALHEWHAAQSAAKAGRLPEAQASLDLCLRVWPDSVPVHLLAARVARLRGDFEEAEAQLNRCLKLHNGATEDVQLEFLLMRAQTGEVDQLAPALFAYVDKGHPDSSLILETVARAYMHDLRYGPALACLDRWIADEPENARPYHWRAWVFERGNDPHSAMKNYLIALELDPSLVPVRLRVAEMLLEDSKPQEALSYLEPLHKELPDRADITARLGQCRFLQGQVEEAHRLLMAALENLPDDPALLITLAKLELQEGRTAEAESWLDRALKADPYETEAEYTLYLCFQREGRQDRAAAALARYEKHKFLLERANKLLKDEVGRSPSDPSAPSEAGDALLHIGQERLGLYWLQEALKRDPNHQPSHRVLAEYYESKGDKEKAAAHRSRLTQSSRKEAAP